MPHHGDYQNAIHLAGLGDVTPPLPVDSAKLGARRRRDAAVVLDYVLGRCGDEHTQHANAIAPRR